MRRAPIIRVLMLAALAVGLVLAGVGAAKATVRDQAPICTDALLNAGLPCVIPDTTTTPTTPTVTTPTTTTAPTAPVNPLHNCVLYSDPSVEGTSCPLVKLAAFPSTVKKGTKMIFHGSAFDSSKWFSYDIEIHVGNQPIGGKPVTDSGEAISHKTRAYPTLTWKAKRGSYDVCTAALDLKSTSVAFDCGLLTVS